MENQSCHDNLKLLIRFGFQINWTLLLMGYRGHGFIPPILTQKDICMYAMEQLELTDDYLVAILADSENNSCEFDETLEKLSRYENVSTEIQLRKLRVLVLYREFKSLPDQYVDGLLALSEAWISLGMPDDCPHVFQGRNNSLSPDEYYTQSMYDYLKEKNFNWLDKEITYIITQEKVEH